MNKFYTFLFFLFSITFPSIAQTYEQWIGKSVDHIERNRLDSAEYTLKKALQTDPSNPNNASLLMSLGVIQRESGRYEDAYMTFTAALNNYPDSKLVLHNRAALLCDMERYDEALNDYSEILRLDPSNVQAYYRRGVLHLERKQRDLAEADFRKAQQIDPDNMYALLSNALIYKLDDNWTEAEKMYSRLIDKNENVTSTFYLNRAECYVNTNQIFKASADLKSAEPGERQNPYFYFLRGRVRLAQYDKLAAKADFEKAKQLGYAPEIADEWIKKAK
ncbi:MAG: tetratricopeptide repeat protein [Dysgonomonadaceae bacterium]|nr:tetratricopeptide repeat protein [Dysgonamonadaceae bacterium]